MRPIIGINAGVSRCENESPAINVGASYVDAVTSAGGIPVVLPPVESLDMAEAHVRLCDGFLLTGGADLDPARFGATPHPTVNRLPLRRENYDFELIRIITEARKPFVAICLGCQEVNVAQGGTLVQDIGSETSTTIRHSVKQNGANTTHPVSIKKNTKLHELVETTTLVTNSFHHQAIKDIGKKITVSSHSEDGVIESFELKDYPFGLGIQWHPERMTDEKEHLAILKGLVEAARKTAKRP